MSDFFDDLGAAARRVASGVNTEITVAALEQKVREAYQALGRLHYGAVQNGRAPQGAEFDALMVQIRQQLEEINRLRGNQRVDPQQDFANP